MDKRKRVLITKPDGGLSNSDVDIDIAFRFRLKQTVTKDSELDSTGAVGG